MSRASLAATGPAPGAGIVGGSRYLLAGLVAACLLARFALASTIGLSIDETYGVVMARHLSAGYVDHPPLTWWLIAGSVRLFGSEAPVVARIPSILLFAGSTWLVERLTSAPFGRRAGLYAALAFSLSPLFGFYIGLLATTDGPVLFTVLACVLCLTHVLRATTRRAELGWWMLTGLCFGLAITAKYSAVLLLGGFGLFLVTAPRRWRLLLGPGPYLAGLIAAAIFSPVLVWNAQHGWISFVFQGSRGVPGGALHPLKVLAALAAEAGLIWPPIWGGLVFALWTAFRRGPRHEPAWLFACLAAVPVAVFLLVKLWSSQPDNGFHWGAPGYALAFPLLGYALACWTADDPRRDRIVRRWSWATTAVLAACALAFASHTLTGWGARVVPALAERDPLVMDQVEWSDLPRTLRSRGRDPARTFVVAQRWDQCAKADYALAGEYPLLCLSRKPVHYAFLNGLQNVAGRDAVIVGRKLTLDQARAELGRYFSAIEPAEPIEITAYGRPMFQLTILHGRGFSAAGHDSE